MTFGLKKSNRKKENQLKTLAFIFFGETYPPLKRCAYTNAFLMQELTDRTFVFL